MLSNSGLCLCATAQYVLLFLLRFNNLDWFQVYVATRFYSSRLFLCTLVHVSYNAWSNLAQEIQFWEFMSGRQANTNWFWVDPIYHNTRNEASQLSLLYDNKGRSRTISRKRATVLLWSDGVATCCTFLCSYYSRAAFISLESPQTSATAG